MFDGGDAADFSASPRGVGSDARHERRLRGRGKRLQVCVSEDRYQRSSRPAATVSGAGAQVVGDFLTSMHQEGMVNGEIIVLEDEVDRVLSAALGAGLQVTALSVPHRFSRSRVFSR